MTNIQALFDSISDKYDFLNNLISLGMHYFVKKYAIRSLNIKQNSKILDLCCGTGDLGRIIKNENKKSEVIGLDFSSKMLEIAENRNKNIEYINADVTNIPFEDNSFDYVVMGFGLRNIPQRELAITEIKRILKPNGQFLHLDFGKHNFADKILNFIIIFMAKFFSKNYDAYKYLIESKNKFPEPQKLINEFEHKGFALIRQKDLLFGTISFQIFSVLTSSTNF